MLADTPLVKNLDNQNYMNILLKGKATLEERFAAIDSTMVRDELIKKDQTSQKILPEIVKLIKEPKLPEVFATLFTA